MISETLYFLAAFVALTLIGLGPALWLANSQDRQWNMPFYIAPSIGLALVELIGFPLVRYLGPIQLWAVPATFGAIVVSVVLVLLNRNKYGTVLKSARWNRIILTGGYLGACFLILAAPMVLNGIQYAVFRSNSSDAFVYMSLAETTRVVPWAVMVKGASFTPQNMEGITQLASLSPTSLFTARLIALSFGLNNTTALGWLAAVGNLPVYRLFYVYHLLCLACALPLTLAIGKRLALNSRLVYLSGAAILLGFWARYVLETDASAEIAALPLMMLAVFGWIVFEEKRGSGFPGTYLLIATGVAGVLLINFPVLAVLIGAMGLFYLVELVQRKRTLGQSILIAIPFILALLIILLTGQFDYFFGNLVRGLGSVSGQAAFRAPAFEMLSVDHITALWGMPRNVLFGELRSLFRIPLQLGALAIAIFLTVALLLTLFLVLRRKNNAADRIILSLVAAAFLLFGYFSLAKNGHSAEKALTYVFPYLILAPSLLTKYCEGWVNVRAQRIIAGLVSVWLGLQILMSFYLPYNSNVQGIFREGDAWYKAEGYDLTPILTALDGANPSHLVVDVKRTKDWTFAYYTMFALAKYNPYFLSGLVIDNNVKYKNLWFGDLPVTAEYAVTSRKDDYIAARNLGVPVASTKDLVLYHLTVQDTRAFEERVKEYQVQDSAKPFFPSLQP